MTKAELRRSYLEKRKEISEAEYIASNKKITELFFSFFDLSFTRIVHTYLPIVANKEPDTWLILERIRREFPAVRLVVPRINIKSGHLEHFFFEGLHQLEENSWGIQQPRQGIPVKPVDVDMVLVPLLAIDKAGNRIGYGKGYYDRFLAMCRADCKKVGLSLFPPAEAVPSNQFDVALDYCVTPSKVVEF